jgi:nucleoid DNA-binding protein
MTFAELANLVSERTGYPREETRVICEEFVSAILERLYAGDQVRIKRLGSFIWKELAARKIKLPSGKRVKVPERLRLLFRPSLGLRKGLRRTDG